MYMSPCSHNNLHDQLNYNYNLHPCKQYIWYFNKSIFAVYVYEYIERDTGPEKIWTCASLYSQTYYRFIKQSISPL